MDCKTNKLSVISYVNGFTLWHYIDKNISRGDVDDTFFSRVSRTCAQGDKIILNLKDGFFEAIVVEISNQKVYLKDLTHLYYNKEEAK